MVSRRWAPLGGMVSLRDAMDRLLEQSFVRPDRGAASEVAGARALPIELCEREADYLLRAYVPGARVEDIDINVDRGTTLTVKASIPGHGDEAADHKWIVAELGYGEVARSITLPTTVDVNKIDASVENGVLTIVLPKAEEAKPRQIKITAK